MNPTTQTTYLASEEFFMFALDEEVEWRKSRPRLTDKELIEIFRPSGEMLREKIREWQVEYEEEASRIKESLTRLEENESKEICEILIKKLWVPRLIEIDKHSFRLKRLSNLIEKPNTPKERAWQNMPEMIAQAKTKPIAELARSRLDLKPSGRNFTALCPFHNEKTPSFYLYTDSNHYHCYGCQAHGDVITLTMHLHGTGFTEAVKMLQ